jgi:thioredoxin 1
LSCTTAIPSTPVFAHEEHDSMPTININADDFEDTITKNDIVLVDFWADWCGPCKRFAPIYEKASEEYRDVTFAKLDTEENVGLTAALNIEGIPTLMAFREGVLVFNQAGALPGQALKQVIDAVKGLNMEEVHAQVAKLQAEHEHQH